MQPYLYARRELVEPDWRRFPGWRDVTREQWESAQWQRAHCVKNVRQLRAVLGDLIDDRFYTDLETDQQRMATMSMLLPPQMLNTMTVTGTDAFYADRIPASLTDEEKREAFRRAFTELSARIDAFLKAA